jgi:hypothetical protein
MSPQGPKQEVADVLSFSGKAITGSQQSASHKGGVIADVVVPTGLPSNPLRRSRFTHNFIGSAQKGNCPVFAFWVVGQWADPAKPAS